jgi:hypothetical protein
MYSIYSPSAVLWNIVDKFGLELSPEDRIKLFQMTEDPENSDGSIMDISGTESKVP